MNRALLTRFLQVYPFQPATAVWRTIEIVEVLRFPWPRGRGLDLGSGDGLLTGIVLDEAGATAVTVVGVDPDPDEAALAERLALYERIHVTGAEDIPEPDGSFDWVYSNSVLEHVDHIDAILAETRRILRPGGTFVFTVPSDGFHACLRGPLLPFSSRVDYLKRLDQRLHHLRYWGIAEWTRHLNAAGLSLDTAVPYMSSAETRRWETVSRFTAGVLYLAVLGRRKPMEIQRKLGMRRLHRMPRPLAVALCLMLTLGMRRYPNPSASASCLLIRASRPVEPTT